jgi:HTH-type transcriptional regulator / antitoxin HigA
MEDVMSATLLDKPKYRQLLGNTLPVVIHTDAEHRRLLRAASELMDKPEEEIGDEEGRLLEMLAMLIEEYEDRRHPLPQTEPHKMLGYLLAEKGMKPVDLSDILPRSRVSEILSGKRGISKTQAKQLAARFRVPVDLFL